MHQATYLGTGPGDGSRLRRARLRRCFPRGRASPARSTARGSRRSSSVALLRAQGGGDTHTMIASARQQQTAATRSGTHSRPTDGALGAALDVAAGALGGAR